MYSPREIAQKFLDYGRCPRDATPREVFEALYDVYRFQEDDLEYFQKLYEEGFSSLAAARMYIRDAGGKCSLDEVEWVHATAKAAMLATNLNEKEKE